ncbi:hypothetical protein Gorai_009239, partial [Gossypium raimondii]|nr:hypothetical protein [Gossypium raimondii]
MANNRMLMEEYLLMLWGWWTETVEGRGKTTNGHRFNFCSDDAWGREKFRKVEGLKDVKLCKIRRYFVTSRVVLIFNTVDAFCFSRTISFLLLGWG